MDFEFIFEQNNFPLEEWMHIAEKVRTILFSHSKKPWCLFLRGQLGVGKTTFSRFFIGSLMGDIGFIPSPSFPIMIPYEFDWNQKKHTLYHMDFYRLGGKNHKTEQLLSQDIQESVLSGYSIIEWPEFSPVDFSLWHGSLEFYVVDISFCSENRSVIIKKIIKF